MDIQVELNSWESPHTPEFVFSTSDVNTPFNTFNLQCGSSTHIDIQPYLAYRAPSRRIRFPPPALVLPHDCTASVCVPLCFQMLMRSRHLLASLSRLPAYNCSHVVAAMYQGHNPCLPHFTQLQYASTSASSAPEQSSTYSHMP